MNAGTLRAALAATLLIIGTTYAVVIRPQEAAIADDYAALEGARSVLERDLLLARRLPDLERERASLAARLARVHLTDSRAALVDRFLHAIARTAQREDVTIQNVASDPRPAAELALDITIRGRYARVIDAVRDLNTSGVAARIALTTLGNAQTRSGIPPHLDATFHVVILREIDEPTIRPARAI